MCVSAGVCACMHDGACIGVCVCVYDDSWGGGTMVVEEQKQEVVVGVSA